MKGFQRNNDDDTTIHNNLLKTIFKVQSRFQLIIYTHSSNVQTYLSKVRTLLLPTNKFALLVSFLSSTILTVHKIFHEAVEAFFLDCLDICKLL